MLERKYEDPIVPTHKILGFKCSEFANKFLYEQFSQKSALTVPISKSINCNIEKKEKQKWLQNGG